MERNKMDPRIKKWLISMDKGYINVINDIENGSLGKEEMTELALRIISECDDLYYEDCTGEYLREPDGLNYTDYIKDYISYLLMNGLDPNYFTSDEENVMWELQYCISPGMGPELLRVFLDNGGDPNIRISDMDESLFEFVNFEIYNGDDHEEGKPEMGMFHFWLLLLAYGGCYSNGIQPIDMLNGSSVEIFKDYQKYEYTESEEPDCDADVIDRETGIVVARM